MSLYNVQKFLYQLNRSADAQAAYRNDREASLQGYELDAGEQRAICEPDIGLLYHMGVNGQLLMHFAALHGIAWADYLQLMRDGIKQHGPVRAGVYAIAGYEGVEAHNRPLGQPSAGAESVESHSRRLGHNTAGAESVAAHSLQLWHSTAGAG